ncbi:MAG: hypothetical protein ABIJ21_03775 [Nanoarchaeota archaeon]
MIDVAHKNINKKPRILYFLLAGLILVLLIQIGYIIAYDRTNVTTRVNITQSLPIITSIIINQGAPINLSEGTVRLVECNVTIIDYNGLADIDKVNATFHRDNVSPFGAQDNNTRYQNYSCEYNQTVNSYTFRYICAFNNVTYHAYNGSWNCSVQVNNTLNYPINGTNSSLIYPLFAMNVTDLIDYGNLSVFDTSNVQQVNVTNWGNQPINLSVYGYGGTSNLTGQELSFICPYGTNITIGNERWTPVGNVSWVTMVNLTSGPRTIGNVTIFKQQTDELSLNTTYWKLYVPPNPFGVCNGTVVYEAQLAGWSG